MRRPPNETPAGDPAGAKGGRSRDPGGSSRGAAGGSGSAAHAIAGELGGVSDLAPGTVLGKYQIVQRLGVGGMGSVYEAIHTGIAKAVALKTMSPQLAVDPKAAARFMREAAAASRLDHPHVVGVTDFGTDRGLSYLVMELLRGEDLGAVIAREAGRLDPSYLADVMMAVCAGVFAAHESGVVHRDLKPQNIFLSRTSLGETVAKVLDFGISKMIEDDVNAPLTNTGMVMGTTHYLSPEQVSGKGVDARSDQYSLGVIMYEALMGRRPHVGDSVYEIMRSISEGNFQMPRAIRPDLPPAFEAVVLRALATRPQDRFESVFGLGRALLPLSSTKRRVIWADYYDRAGGGSGAVLSSNSRSPSGDKMPSVPVAAPRSGSRAAEQAGTMVINVRPAQLSATRTQFLPEELRASILKAQAQPAETRVADEIAARASEKDERPPARSPAGRRYAVLFALGVAGLGAVLLWRSPRLRAQLPDSMRATVERGIAAFNRPRPAPAPETPSAAAEPADDTAAPKPADAPKGAKPKVALTRPEKRSPLVGNPGWPYDSTIVTPDAGVAKAAGSPGDAGSSDAASDGGVRDAGAKKDAPDAGAGKAAVAKKAAPDDDGPATAAPIKAKKRRVAVPSNPQDVQPQPRPPAPPPPEPQPEPNLPPPEQIPAKKFFSPAGAPILE